MRMTMFSKREIDDIHKYAYATPLNHFWIYAREAQNFEESKKAFLFIVQSLLERGVIKLGTSGVLWTGSIESQIKRMKDILPANAIAMIQNQMNDPITSYNKSDDSTKLQLECVWFFTEDCPVQVMWRTENGWEMGT